MSFDWKKFNEMGGAGKYGFGANGWGRASEEYKKLKKANKLQMIGFYTFLVAMIGVVIFIASTQK